MIELSVNDLHKYYGANHVIQGISLEINSGEKVGLLGKNGSGKTTLFKILSEDEHYESGNVAKASGKKVEMLAQIPVFAEGDSVEDILCSSFKEALTIHEAMKKIEGDSDPSVLMQYGQLMEEYERLGGYDIEVKIEKICNGMKITEEIRKTPFHLLSGGEKTRINLARILLRDCDILLLDEPTNHLDLTMLAWLESFLRDFPGTVVVISHDRVFLDHVIKRVIEMDNGKLNFYAGNYSFYVEEKERRFLTQAEQYKQQQRKIRQLEAAAKRQRIWGQINPSNTGLMKRALAIEKRIEQMEKVEKPAVSKKLTEEFNSGGYAAKEIVAFDSVYKGYGEQMLLDNVSLSIRRNDSIALIGANGCGKTTLLKLIMEEEACDSGLIKVSSNVRIAYMPQIIYFDDENATVLDTLRYAVGLPEEKVRSILAGFHFKAADVIKKVGNLSGGEKSRLKLCLLMQNKVNFLILDEPTNHLDIESREWIEDAVSDFDGTLLFISHDRYFLNQFAARIWSMEDGTITEFDGAFEDYLTAIASAAKQPDSSAVVKKKKKQPAKTKEPPTLSVSPETLIYEAESELDNVNQLIDIGLSNRDYEKMNSLYQEKQRLEDRLAFLYSQWMEDNEGGHGNA